MDGEARQFLDRRTAITDSIFQRCVESANDAIMLTDKAGNILYVNPAWERLYGFSKKEAVGANPRLLRSNRHDKEFYTKMWKEILDPSRGFWKGEVINRTKQGTLLPVLLTISPFTDEKRGLSGYMSIAVDISEKKQLEAQVFRADRLASMGLLASGLAHEVGTPLGVIRGRAEFVLRGLPKDSPERRSIDTIVAQTDRISKLIYSLLNLARPERSEVATAVALPKVIEDVKVLLDPQFGSQSIHFYSEIQSGVRVLAEKERLEQVFLNLFINAMQSIESAKQDGSVGPHFIRTTAKEKDGAWEISVEDNGSGISKENMKHLFKPFFTTKEVGSGTGLGLAVIHQMLHAWGGTIWAESPNEYGAIFTMTIPKA